MWNPSFPLFPSPSFRNSRKHRESFFFSPYSLFLFPFITCHILNHNLLLLSSLNNFVGNEEEEEKVVVVGESLRKGGEMCWQPQRHFTSHFLQSNQQKTLNFSRTAFFFFSLGFNGSQLFVFLSPRSSPPLPLLRF